MVSAGGSPVADVAAPPPRRIVAVRPLQAVVLVSATIAVGAVVALSIDRAVMDQAAASWRLPLLALVGAGLGFVLFQATFGFAGSFRDALERRDFSGFRAQALALALTSVVFFPLLAVGELFGLPLTGFVTPVGVSFGIGAVPFGIGMQIGGGCASGTLFALGGGNARLLMTLACFILGSVVGAAHLDFWWSLPALPAGTSQDWLGWPSSRGPSFPRRLGPKPIHVKESRIPVPLDQGGNQRRPGLLLQMLRAVEPAIWLVVNPVSGV